jgi:PHD-finger
VVGHRQIPADHYDEHEELAAEHIVCCACGNEEADDDNDILLCDGHGCSRAYHVQCLPFKDNFDLQRLLDSDDGWLCPACDCRYDILWDLTQALDLDFEHLIEQKCAPPAL